MNNKYSLEQLIALYRKRPHEDWNLIDIVWENEACWYRAMWCMTA